MDKRSLMGNGLKRRYFDLRLGGLTVNPAIQASNFIMLAYLSINDFIPFWLFVPLFMGGLIVSFILVGNKFRNIQFETDTNMLYEKSTEQAKTNYIILCALMDNSSLATSTKIILQERAQYLQKIIDKEL